MAFLTIFLLVMGIGVAIALAVSAIAIIGYLGALSIAVVIRFIIPLGIVAMLFLCGVFLYFLSHNDFATPHLLLLAGVFVSLALTTFLIGKANLTLTEKQVLFFQSIVLVCLTASYHYCLEINGFFAFILAMFSSLPFAAYLYQEPIKLNQTTAQ